MSVVGRPTDRPDRLRRLPRRRGRRARLLTCCSRRRRRTWRCGACATSSANATGAGRAGCSRLSPWRSARGGSQGSGQRRSRSNAPSRGRCCRTQDLLPGVELGFQLDGICLGHFGPPCPSSGLGFCSKFAAKGRFAVWRLLQCDAIRCRGPKSCDSGPRHAFGSIPPRVRWVLVVGLCLRGTRRVFLLLRRRWLHRVRARTRLRLAGSLVVALRGMQSVR